MRTLVIIPTYNEADNLALLLEALLALPAEFDVCIVDDASPDGTGDLAAEWAQRNPRVQLLRRTGKLGLGTAYVAGFMRALDQHYDATMTMDADFSHHPRYVPALLQALVREKADLVIGSRYVAGGQLHYPFYRRFLSQTSNAVARLCLGLSVRDCTAGFRLYRTQFLRQLPLTQIYSNGYSFLVEMLAMSAAAQARIVEVPIVFEDRTRGQSKISNREIIKAIATIARLMSKR